MTTVAPYPLQWPASRPRTPDARRKSPKFTKGERHHSATGSWVRQREITVADALKRLQDELDRIGARLPVVSTNLETRLDGLPRSGQRAPNDPGVAVYFQLKGQPVCLPCDTYKTVAANIAAVAAHIEATRAIERHGVATVAEMFQGFALIEAPGKKSWWDILQCRRDATREIIEAQFRRLARDRHPDAGGSHEMMAELNAARDAAIKERA
jgi:hypothetical protein